MHANKSQLNLKSWYENWEESKNRIKSFGLIFRNGIWNSRVKQPSYELRGHKTELSQIVT